MGYEVLLPEEAFGPNGFLEVPDDLSLLKIISPDEVRAFAQSVNEISPDDLAGRKLVLLIATGGTLAMTTTDGVRFPAFRWKEVFRPAESLLHNRFEIRGINAFCIDSSQMDYSHTREVAIVLSYLWRNVKVPFLGFLVTHGTDTMSYASAATSLMMGQGLPFSVVYTGAQRPLDDPMSDTPLNLRNALCVLESLYENDMAEVLIVMGERAILATSAEKVDDTALNAFDAPRHCFVSRLNRLAYPIPLARWLKPRRHVPFRPTIWRGDYSKTLVVKSVLGLSPVSLQRQVLDPEVKAVILYSYGAGTVHAAILGAVLSVAKERALPVFIVNPVNAEYRAEYESAAEAIRQGVVPLNMTLSAALAKVEIALCLFPHDPEKLSAFMMENYVGEVPTHDSSVDARRSA